MKKEKIMKEFLHTIDCDLFEMDKNSLTVKSKDGVKTLPIPIKFATIDNQNKLEYKESSIGYRINVVGKRTIQKNEINFFDLSLRKSKTIPLTFTSEVHQNDIKNFITIGKITSKDFCNYRKEQGDKITSIIFSENENEKQLELTISKPRMERKIIIKRIFQNKKSMGVLVVIENGEEVFKERLEINVVDEYFTALAYRLRSLIEESNKKIEELNKNIFEMVFAYNRAASDFLNLVRNSNKSNNIIDMLLVTYFTNTFSNLKRRARRHQDKVTLDERGGWQEDYTDCQEQQELKRYKSYLSSSAYDDQKGIDVSLQRKIPAKKE